MELEEFINDEVWKCTLKYVRMMGITKEKFFEDLKNGVSVEEYEEKIRELWDIDHSYMDKAIKELEEMVAKQDLSDFYDYGESPITKTQSVKLEDGKLYYENYDRKVYPLNPDSDFTAIENKYVNDHIKAYSNQSKVLDQVSDKNSYLSELVPKYDKLDKTIPYYNKDGSLKCYNTVATYNSMLYNVNLTRSAWNRTEYDGDYLDNPLRYLVAHPYACPHCMFYQGKVYTTDPKDKRYPQKSEAIAGGVGHPNCKHTWSLYWGKEQIQRDKYNSGEWEEKYKNQQKLQSLDLEKSRLLSDRRIYKSLGEEGKVDECSKKIAAIREKKKEIDQS